MSGDDRRGGRAELRELLDFGRFFEDYPLPMWIYDVQSQRILDVNAAAVRHYGYSRRELRRMTLLDVRAPEEIAGIERPTAELGPDVTRGRHRKKDGTTIDVEVVECEVRFGGRAARLATLHDVTERVRADQQTRFQAPLASPPPVPSARVRLSDREREVLKLIAEGYTNREAARALAISVKSVETYRGRVMEKLGLATRAELVRFALECGVLATGKRGV